MAKSADAFRTISEVAEWLGVQTHVLRFWESKFSQVRPVKRAGGRRYYRPADMLLLGGIRRLLHHDGLTIKGVQKVLREEGVAYVADLSQPLDDLTTAEIDEELVATETPALDVPDDNVQAELPLQGLDVPSAAATDGPPPIVADPVAEGIAASTDISVDATMAQSDNAQPETEVNAPSEPVIETGPDVEATPERQPAETEAPMASDTDFPDANPIMAAAEIPQSESVKDAEVAPNRPDLIVAEAVEQTPEERLIMGDPTAEPEAEIEPEREDSPVPNIVDVPETPAINEIAVSAGLVSRLSKTATIAPAARVALPDLRAQLASLRDRMAGETSGPS